MAKFRSGECPARYRKKPIEVEAMRWTGENHSDIKAFISCERNMQATYTCTPAAAALSIYTPEGWIHASAGDWIIKGVAGEFYPCKPDIFDQTYEAV